jgi:hypothetical protein
VAVVEEQVVLVETLAREVLAQRVQVLLLTTQEVL